MFPTRYFPARYFPGRYYPHTGGTSQAGGGYFPGVYYPARYYPTRYYPRAVAGAAPVALTFGNFDGVSLDSGSANFLGVDPDQGVTIN